MKIGVGITTYNRPDYFRQSFKAAIEKLSKVVDVWCVYDDGSSQGVKEYDEIFDEIVSKYPFVQIFRPRANGGVAKAKNTLLKHMMSANCDYMFLLEDDIIIKDEKAVTGYIQAAKKSGFTHLCFAYHGPMNQAGPLYSDQWLEYHGASIGAWCMFTKEIIDTVGYFDENFTNAWEHCEFTKRIGDYGFCPPFGLFIDATGSKDWLKEIPGSIEKSAIRPRKDWQENIDKGLKYWKQKDGIGLPEL
ncbi:MAG: glycosyltransferase family 2 protein [Bacteroidia bacterium]|nr:glycosyltransferase family 2 protein [Bacteroidia bacterium]